MVGRITVMQHTSKFTELSRFVLEFVASKRMNMRRSDEVLAFYIHNQLAGQPIKPIKGSMSVQLKWDESSLS